MAKVSRRVSFRTLAWLPAALLLCAAFCWLSGSLIGGIVQRQLINCYVSLTVFLLFLLVTVRLLLDMKRAGLGAGEILSQSRCGALLLCTGLLILGSCFLKTSCLSHAWFQWPLSKRIAVALYNSGLTLSVASVLLALNPVWYRPDIRARARAFAFLGMLFWSYLCASGARMLSIYVGVE